MGGGKGETLRKGQVFDSGTSEELFSSLIPQE